MQLKAQLKNIFFGRMKPSFYRENKIELRNTNYRLLRKACLFSSGMCFFLFLMTLLNQLISELTWFYLFYTLFFSILTFAVLSLVNRRRRLVPYFFYLFAAAIFLLVIDAGTRITPTLPAVTFHVFLLIIPILYVTRPINAVFLSIAACAVFCVVTAAVKGPGSYLAQTDMLNAVICCIIGIGVDTTIINLHLENIQGKAYFKRMSATDRLTGLPNRRSFDNLIEKQFLECSAAKENMVVMIMDIDNFKAYNGTYGHVQGDECLRAVAKILELTAQEQGSFLARFGGEEFVAVAVIQNQEELNKIVQQFVHRVYDLDICHKNAANQRISISLGYATRYDTQAENYRKLLDCADAALYEAKAAGKNQAKIWCSEI